MQENKNGSHIRVHGKTGFIMSMDFDIQPTLLIKLLCDIQEEYTELGSDRHD